MNTTTISSKHIQEFEERLDVRLSTGLRPNFAIVFSSPKQAISEIQAIMLKRNIDLIGCTSAGEIVDDLVLEHAIVALLLEVPEGAYKSYVQHIEPGMTAGSTAELMATQVQLSYTQPSILLLSSGIKNDGSEIVKGIQHVLGKDVTLVGGLAGDDLQLVKTEVFNNHVTSDNGIAMVAFDANIIELKGLAISGWKSIGPVLEVTRSENNVVYEIDNTPAMKLYNRFVGLSDQKHIVLEEGVKYPLQVYREDGTTVLRAPLFSTEDGGLMFPGGIKEGEKVHFCVPPDFDVIDSTVQEFANYGKQANTEADAMILFSCFARHIAFGPMIRKEIQGIRAVWNKPMIGFFTYGEIGNTAEGGSDFHNETCSLLLIKEKK
jgi:hypothetical protein